MNHVPFLATLLLVGGGFLQARPVAHAGSPDGELQVSGVVAGGDSVSSSKDNEMLGTLALVDGISLSREELTLPESLQTAVKPKLLPDNISFMERALWGENGFIRNIGIASPLTPEVRKHELGVRRTMLTMHQIGGFVTLGSMLATVYYGQKYMNSGQRSDRNMHQLFIPITIACYSVTGLLSVLSPPPLIRRDETSTTTIHKTLAWVHAAGMILTPILGLAINKRGTSISDKAHYHQIAAYITTAVFAASMIIITF
jgi:hypothetical protein